MNSKSIFDAELILQTEKPDCVLAEITQTIAIILQVDRCFLYVRDPESRYGQAAFCYCRNPDVEDVSSDEWELEQPKNLEDKDPMFAAALNCKPEVSAPKDFTQEGQTSVEHLTKHVHESLYRGRWVALLTSMHTCFLNQGSDSDDIVQFIKEIVWYW